jgi:uncharacterized protein YndB with AHSA1/START domain
MSESLVIEVVRKTVTVDCAVEEAFRIFTADPISWWPIATHSVHGEAVTEIVLEPRAGGELYEVTGAGERAHWASVVAFEPPSAGDPGRLVLEWNILNRQGDATEVEVQFVADGHGTRVELEHRGWEHVALEGPAKRDSYDTGWNAVLGEYVAAT